MPSKGIVVTAISEAKTEEYTVAVVINETTTKMMTIGVTMMTIMMMVTIAMEIMTSTSTVSTTTMAIVTTMQMQVCL